MTNQPVPNSNSSIEWMIAQERLRQARYSFNLALTTTAVSFCISLVGAGLLMSDKVPSGAITSAIGLVSSVRYFEFAKDANDRLDKILDESEDDN
jgi:CHASE2 domain-containing sensor protein